MKSKRAPTGGAVEGDGWKVTGPKLKLRHVAVLRTGKWMGKRANTRVPAGLIVGGYPATLLVPLFSPLVVSGVALLTSLVVWHVSYRSVVSANEHASKAKLGTAADWATRVAALVPLYLAWILLVRWHTSSVDDGGLVGFAHRVGALFGVVFNGSWFLGYASAGTAAWLVVFRAPHVITRHHSRKAAEASPFTADIGFEGSKMLSRKATRVGERYVLSIANTGKAVSEFLAAGIKEKVAAKFGLPASRVLISPVGKNAGHLEVAIRRTDPWDAPLVHPAAPDYRRRLKRRITGPIVIGMEPENGTPLEVELATNEGGQHLVIIAGTRGGKTTLANSLLELLTSCSDVDVAMIDVTKGKDGRAWAPAVAESYMGPESTLAALECLERHAALIATRAANNRDAVWRTGPEPDRRAKVIFLDEASAMLASPDQVVAQRAKTAVSYILGKGASEMVILVIMSQRGVLAHLGTGDVAANTFTKILLGVAKRAEMMHVISDWESQGMPDMSKYGEGRKGVVMISPVGRPWSAGRCYDLSDLNTIRKIAADRVIRDDRHLAILAAENAYAKAHPVQAEQEPSVSDELTLAALDFDVDPALLSEPPEDGTDDPDDPDNVPGAAWGTPSKPETPAMPRELTEREKRMMASFGQPAAPAGGWRAPAELASVQAVKALAEVTKASVETVDRALAVELARPAEESAARWANREAATAVVDQGKTVPDDFKIIVLRLIDANGSTNRAMIVRETGLGNLVVAERLRVMTNQGQLSRSGGHYVRP